MFPGSGAAALLAVIAALPAGCPSCYGPLLGRSWPPAREGYVNPIPAENALPGDAHWADGPDSTAHEIEGYADRISARAGDSIPVRVSSSTSTTASWSLYRLGWYGGAGARLVGSGGPVSVDTQPACPVEQG